MAGDSHSYNFASVGVSFTLTDEFSVYPAGSAIDMTAQGFFDATDSINIAPNQEYITDDIGPDGTLYPSVSGDQSGGVTISAADKTPLHQFLVALRQSHTRGLNIKGVNMTIRVKSVGKDVEAIWTCKNGHVAIGSGNKSLGNKQTGNSFVFRFESITDDIEDNE